MILRLVASFSPSMSPWRAMATPFVPEMTSLLHPCFAHILKTPRLKEHILNKYMFGGYFEWVRPIQKDAHRISVQGRALNASRSLF